MENDAIGTIEMVEATSTNRQVTVTRLRIKEEDVISSTTIHDSSKKSTATKTKVQKTQEHLSNRLLQPEEIEANPKDNSSKKSPEVENKEDNNKEESSKKSPEPKKIEEHSKPDAPNPDIKKEDVKRHHEERKSVPVLEGVKAPSLDDSEESLQAFKLRRRKKKKHNELMQKQMITHSFKLVKKV